MAFTENLTDFFYDEHGFAVNATLGAATVTVIFDAAYADAFGLVAGTAPTALGISTQLATAAIGGTITINAVAYTITAIQPDGTGLTRLMLQEA